MTKYKQTLLIIIGILLFIILVSPKANPDSPELFKIKRLQEKMFFAVQPSPSRKATYYLSLLDTRAQELDNLVKNNSYSYILSSSLRYSTTAGKLTELILQNGLQKLIPSTLEKFKSHQKLFKSLLTDYPTEENDSWKFLQDDINYLTIYTGFLLEPRN